MPELPVVTSFLVCDHLWCDPRTGRWNAIGTFDEIRASTLPVTYGEIGVYVNLTNLNGIYEFELKLLRAGDEKELLSLADVGPITVRNPLERIRIGITVEDMEIPRFGRYLLRLMSGGQRVHDVVFSVSQPREAP